MKNQRKTKEKHGKLKKCLKIANKTLLVRQIIAFILVVTLMLPIIPVYAQKNKFITHKGDKTEITKKKQELLDTKFSIKDVPDELIENADVNVNKVKAIDEVDSLDLKSFTTVNSNNTKTVHVYNEPIKYYDKKENCIKFIDSSLKKSEKINICMKIQLVNIRYLYQKKQTIIL